MKNSASFAFVVCAQVALNLSASAAHAQATLTGLRVKRHTTTAFPATLLPQIDNAFIQATNALRNDRGGQDVACPVTLTRMGDLGTTSITDGTINNLQDQIDIRAEWSNQAYMIVVNALTFCGTEIQIVGGCAPGVLSPFLMTDAALETFGPPPTPNFGFQGNLLAHEYGHTMDLAHTPATPARDIEIMHPFIFDQDTGVPSCNQCVNFRGNWGTGLSYILSLTNPPETCTNPVASTTGFRTSGLCSGAASNAGHKSGRFNPVWRQRHAERSPPLQNLRRSIIDFATNVVWDQTPTDLHEMYSQTDADELRALLKNDALIAKRPWILSILGLISTGVPEDVEALAEYFQRPGANVSAAGIALGYIAARVDSGAAFDFLLTQHGSSDDKVAKGALLGLAMSGKPPALRFIRERRLERAESVATKKANIKSSYDEAERANLIIAARGRKGYYGRE
jgi:hypothetical protein